MRPSHAKTTHHAARLVHRRPMGGDEPLPSWVARGNLVEGIIVVSPDWICLHLNEVATRLGPDDAERFVGRHFHDCFPTIVAAPEFAELQRCMRERTAGHWRQTWPGPHGQSRWVELDVEPVREGLCLHTIDLPDEHPLEGDPWSDAGHALESLVQRLPLHSRERHEIAGLRKKLDTLSCLARAEPHNVSAQPSAIASTQLTKPGDS